MLTNSVLHVVKKSNQLYILHEENRQSAGPSTGSEERRSEIVTSSNAIGCQITPGADIASLRQCVVGQVYNWTNTGTRATAVRPKGHLCHAYAFEVSWTERLAIWRDRKEE